MITLGGFIGFYLFLFFSFLFFCVCVLINTSVLLVRNILLGINEMNIGPEEHFNLLFSSHVFTTHYFLIVKPLSSCFLGSILLIFLESIELIYIMQNDYSREAWRATSSIKLLNAT